MKNEDTLHLIVPKDGDKDGDNSLYYDEVNPQCFCQLACSDSVKQDAYAPDEQIASRKSYTSPNSLQSIGFSTAAIASASAASMPYLVYRQLSIASISMLQSMSEAEEKSCMGTNMNLSGDKSCEVMV